MEQHFGKFMMPIAYQLAAGALAINLLLTGCVSGASKYTNAPPDFEEGLTALGEKNFPLASYHFAELAKEGNPAAMNNLGVALVMVDRKDEANYWFKKAARYGNIHARDTLARLGEPVPAPDLVGRHPTQLQREATDRFVIGAVVGALLGVSLYYAHNQGTLSPNFNPNLLQGTPPVLLTPTVGKAPAGSSTSKGSTLIETGFEGRDPYTGIRYTGTADSFGNVSLRPALQPGGDVYKGTLDKFGPSTLRNSVGN